MCLTNKLAYYRNIYNNYYCKRFKVRGTDSQNFIFCVTYEWAQKASVFVPDEHFQRTEMQHSSLLGQFVRYEENRVLWIQPQGAYSQFFMLFAT